MTPQELGKKLVAFCKQGKNIEAIETLYSPEIVSLEALAMPGMQKEMHGVEAIKGKNKWWLENHEIHSSQIEGPFPHGDRIAVFYKYDLTSKMTKKRFMMEEVALYTVKSDKIVREEFFYSPE